MRDPIAEIERARSALWHLDAGTDRETWVKHAMGAKAAGLDFDDFHNWSATAGNYRNEAECRSVWQSIKDGAVTAASLFGAARDAGWTDDGEAPAKRPQSQQGQSKEREQPKAPLHDARALWDACTPATADQEYIARKLGLADGLRVYDGPLTIAGMACDGALVLPVRTLAGDLVDLQFVILKTNVLPGKSDKMLLPGVQVSRWPDACLIIGGPIGASEIVYLAEPHRRDLPAHRVAPW